MKLLVDIGNTRVKWALWTGKDFQFAGVVAHGDFSAAAWQELRQPIRPGRRRLRRRS